MTSRKMALLAAWASAMGPVPYLGPKAARGGRPTTPSKARKVKIHRRKKGRAK